MRASPPRPRAAPLNTDPREDPTTPKAPEVRSKSLVSYPGVRRAGRDGEVARPDRPEPPGRPERAEPPELPELLEVLVDRDVEVLLRLVVGMPASLTR